MTLLDQLESLLEGDASAIRSEAIRRFDQLAGTRGVILFGAGGLGQKIVRAMLAHGVRPVAFADNNALLHGRVIEGIPVLAAERAAREHPDALFVICIWHAGSSYRQAHFRGQLEGYGITRICSFPVALWRFLPADPHFLVDLPDGPVVAAHEVRSAFDMWSDEASRREFVDQVRLRRTGTFDHLGHPIAHAAYMPPDLLQPSEEVVIDGGAFDGDTFASWIDVWGETFALWLAVEPDPWNVRALRARADALPREIGSKIKVSPCALSDHEHAMSWEPQGSMSATSRHDGDVSVHATTIDVLARELGVRPTIIKLDVEGAESLALAGAESVIRDARPVLAVCVYHLQDHLWTLPLQIKAYCDDYDFFLRAHNEEGFDLVCYAVPKERRLSQ